MHLRSDCMVYFEQKRGTGVEIPHPRSFLGGFNYCIHNHTLAQTHMHAQHQEIEAHTLTTNIRLHLMYMCLYFMYMHLRFLYTGLHMIYVHLWIQSPVLPLSLICAPLNTCAFILQETFNTGFPHIWSEGEYTVDTCAPFTPSRRS